MTRQRLVRPFALEAKVASFLMAIVGIFAASISLAADPAKTQKSNPSPGAKPQAAAAEKDAPKAAHYEFRKEHDPNGIGKFYLGREIAHVMTWHGAPWLERAEREREEKLTLLVKLLGLKPGMTVADIGAGSGVITLMMAQKVKPTGKVIAVDIQEEMLSLLDKKLKQRKVKNVELLLGTVKSPRLKANSIDLALMVDVYHEFEFPHEMVKELAQSLKPGGRIAFVEYRQEDPRVLIKLVHKMSEAQVKKEAGQPEFGLKWVKTHRELPQQHLILFEKPKSSGKQEASPKTP